MNAIGLAPWTRMSFTLWLTRSSPTVSSRRASRATRTLVPTPSVLITRIGRRYPLGMRTIPPNDPTAPAASGVRVLSTSRAIRAFEASAISRSTPAAAYWRSVIDRLRDGNVGQVGELAHPREQVGVGNLLEAADTESRDRV